MNKLGLTMNRYDHGSLVHVVCACYNDDAADVLAIGGEHSVDVLQIVHFLPLYNALVADPFCI